MTKKLVLPAIIVLCTSAMSAASSDGIRVSIKIYQVFPMGGLVVAQPDRKGGLKSTMPIASGKITAAFPNGIVLLDGGGGEEFHDRLIREKISDRIYWLDAERFPDGAGIGHVSEHEFFIGKSSYATDNSTYECSDRWAFFRLKIEPEGIFERWLALRLQFVAASKLDKGRGPDKTLMDKVFPLDYARILLIGFPENADCSPNRGIVYWLAILVQNGPP